MKREADRTGFFDDSEWEEIEKLVGRVVLKWGRLMGLIYGLPSELGFPNSKAVALGLAQMSGDGSRLDYMRKLLQHSPPLHRASEEAVISLLSQLKILSGLIKERDSIIHGIPVWSMKKDTKSRKIIRHGYYLVQHRQWDEGRRFLKIPERVHSHIEQIDQAYSSIFPLAKPLVYADWQDLIGGGPFG